MKEVYEIANKCYLNELKKKTINYLKLLELYSNDLFSILLLTTQYLKMVEFYKLTPEEQRELAEFIRKFNEKGGNDVSKNH